MGKKRDLIPILNSGNFSHILDVTMCWHEKKVPSLLDLFKLQERRLEIKTELIEVTKECESKEYLFELFRRKDALIECMKSRRG
ncbi:hypothetical protein ECANGB1_2389 [Enterospora canceri]|uniref:Uncharacterized protein n=1 Tax=Enterospora canceri TaxID=1081671 RepID=A0A1Y1S4C5_9MICR|nr:hypothetical protein ECANGB1_2389 [Enterospora canceri]